MHASAYWFSGAWPAVLAAGAWVLPGLSAGAWWPMAGAAASLDPAPTRRHSSASPSATTTRPGTTTASTAKVKPTIILAPVRLAVGLASVPGAAGPQSEAVAQHRRWQRWVHLGSKLPYQADGLRTSCSSRAPAERIPATTPGSSDTAAVVRPDSGSRAGRIRPPQFGAAGRQIPQGSRPG